MSPAQHKPLNYETTYCMRDTTAYLRAPLIIVCSLPEPTYHTTVSATSNSTLIWCLKALCDYQENEK